MNDGTPPMERPQAAEGEDSPRPQSELQSQSEVPPAPTANTQPPPPKRRRSQVSATVDACWTCRLRKVKCTGKPESGDSCANCARLELQCSFIERHPPQRVVLGARTTPSRHHTEAGTLRKRAQRACTECHTHKTRCSGDLPRCKRCETCNLQCEYAPAKRKFQHVPVIAASSRAESDDAPAQPTSAHDALSPEISTTGPNGTPPSMHSLTTESQLANKDMVLRHVNAFFDHLYFTPSLGIFHKVTTYKALEDGQFSALKAAAICSVSAFFVSPGPEAAEFAQKCSEQVEFAIFRQRGTLKETNLYLYVLNAIHHHMMGNYGQLWDLVAGAWRLMMGLQLCWEDPRSNRDFKDQEISRRLAWLVFHLDRMVAGGFDAYICCREEHMQIRLPCPESNFNDNRDILVERLSDKTEKGRSNLGLHGYQIRLMSIRHHVLTMSKRFASGKEYLQRERWEVSRVMSDIVSLQQEISSFSTSLPDELRLNDANIVSWLGRPEHQVYRFLHEWICILHIDLYRFSLPAIRETGDSELIKILPSDFRVKSQMQAVAHAITLASFWEVCLHGSNLTRSGNAVLLGDHNIMACAQQCIKVLLITLKHGLHGKLRWLDTTAPLWRTLGSKPITSQSLRALIDVALRVLEPWADIIPSIKPQYVSLVRIIKEFDEQGSYDETDVGLPGLKYDHHRRLPGPHYLLENAFLSQKDGDDDIQLPRGANPAVALAAAGLHAAMPTVSTPAVPGHEDWDTEFRAPEMPMMLQQARGLTESFGPTGIPRYQGMAKDSILPTLAQTEQDNNISPRQNYGFPNDFALASDHGRRLPLITKNTVPLPLPSEHFTRQHSEGPPQSSGTGPLYPGFAGHSYSTRSGYGPVNHASRDYRQSQ